MVRDNMPDEGETVKVKIRDEYPDPEGEYGTHTLYGTVERVGTSSFKFKSELDSTYTIDLESNSVRKLIYQAGGDEDYIDNELIGWSPADESKLI